VIDERMDMVLIEGIARERPEWHFVPIGPVVKLHDSELPRADNIHYLGAKPYEALSTYMAGWDVAIMPFARNESTRFISPTKAPEYLAAGEVGLFAPYERGRGWELKVMLATAAIRGAEAIHSVYPDARSVTIDPLCHVRNSRRRPRRSTRMSSTRRGT
jgi:hypothetical protein